MSITHKNIHSLFLRISFYHLYHPVFIALCQPPSASLIDPFFLFQNLSSFSYVKQIPKLFIQTLMGAAYHIQPWSLMTTSVVITVPESFQDTEDSSSWPKTWKFPNKSTVQSLCKSLHPKPLASLSYPDFYAKKLQDHLLSLENPKPRFSPCYWCPWSHSLISPKKKKNAYWNTGIHINT